MRTYKVEFLHLEKKYLTTLVSADSRDSALAIGRALTESEFEETEETCANEWKVSENWSFVKMLKSFFGRD